MLSVLAVLGLLAVLLSVLEPLAFPASEPYGGPSTAGDTLEAVVSVPSGNGVDAWAVSWDPSRHGFILHEHGGRWSKVYPLGLAARQHPIPILKSLAMTSSVEGWAVGTNGTILHLSGGAWSAVPSPTTEGLIGVALNSTGSEGWAVGFTTILHLSGDRWSTVNGPGNATQ